MKVAQLFNAFFEIFCIALLSVYQIAILILFGWWIIAHDILCSLINKVPKRVQILMFPLHLTMLIFGPFYGLAAINLIGLQKSKKRLRVLFLDIRDSFDNKT